MKIPLASFSELWFGEYVYFAGDAVLENSFGVMISGETRKWKINVYRRIGSAFSVTKAEREAALRGLLKAVGIIICKAFKIFMYGIRCSRVRVLNRES